MKGAGSVWFVCCVSVCKRLRGDVRLDVVGGVRKLKGIPKHESYETTCAIHERQGDKESPKVCTRFKSCVSLYTCPRAPFIGRRRDFYIPRLPSNLRNILSVNMYTNVFYIHRFTGLISYITSLPLVHT
jgi:hypothetical protein